MAKVKERYSTGGGERGMWRHTEKDRHDQPDVNIDRDS